MNLRSRWAAGKITIEGCQVFAFTDGNDAGRFREAVIDLLEKTPAVAEMLGLWVVVVQEEENE